MAGESAFKIHFLSRAIERKKIECVEAATFLNTEFIHLIRDVRICYVSFFFSLSMIKNTALKLYFITEKKKTANYFQFIKT